MDLLKESINNTPKPKPSLKVKLLALFSTVRGFNLLMLVLAQYFSAICIFQADSSVLDVVLNPDLAIIVLCTVCVVSGGYIINNFYDFEADIINRPEKTALEAKLEQRTKLRLYFLLNFMGFAFAYLVSWRASLFFAVYIFLIWLYTHKLRNYPLTGFLSAAILQLLPFFVVFVYYGNFSTVIFAHASYLFFVLLLKELIKGMEKTDGDQLVNHKTLAVVYGRRFSKVLFSMISFLLINPVYYLLSFEVIGNMYYYFYLALLLLLVVNLMLWAQDNAKTDLRIHNLLRFILVAGVFSILLIRF